MKALPINEIIRGDCRKVLPQWPAESIDLVVTSPPYAQQRKHTYGGIPAERYVEWFLPIAAEVRRVLKPSGSFLLNLKDHVEKGERHTYVLELILALRHQGWLWTEQYIWSKKNSHPGKWPNRFRNAWEPIFHFTKSRKFAIYQDAVRVPISEGTKRRLKHLSKRDQCRIPSKTGSGFDKRIANWVGQELVYPSNVLHLPTECGNVGHSAAFPKALPEFFIKLFTRPNDVVCDIFSGAATTAVAAAESRRRYIGIEIRKEFCEVARRRLAGVKLTRR